MKENKLIDSFDLGKAGKLSVRLKDKIKELEESVSVIDSIADAKRVYEQLCSTNNAIEKKIEAKQKAFEEEDRKLLKIRENMAIEQSLATQTLDNIKSANAELVRIEQENTKNKIKELKAEVEKAQKDSIERVKRAGALAKEAEEEAQEFLSAKDKVEAEYNSFKESLFAK